jgi:hypothetical protein
MSSHTFSWHQEREKSHTATDCNYFYLKHMHIHSQQMAEVIAAFFSHMCHNKGMENILVPINSCLHNQKGHTHRLKDCQLQTPARKNLLQPMKKITYWRTCITVSHKTSKLKLKPFN